ncbi:MAG: polyprenyl synthetase family protein [Phycisphaerales bacterium]
MMSLATPPESNVLTRWLEGFDRALDTCVRQQRYPLNLEEAIRYAAGGGGKRLRPGLVFLAAEAAASSAGLEAAEAVERAMPAAIAIELIHTFSLVHDDLPAMDNDTVRRGRPTLHVQAGETMAILAGDAMTALAFGVIGTSDVPAEIRAAQTTELATATNHMIAGQVYDTVGGFPHELAEADRLTVIHRNKTGALIRSACRLGAMATGADDAVIEHLTTYGDALGLMFQISDDLIDVEQDPEHAGKATGKDAAAGKLTYPRVHGIESSREEIGRLEAAAMASADALGEAAAPLVDLCRTMASRTR